MHYQEWPPAGGRWDLAPDTPYPAGWEKVQRFVRIPHPVPLSPIWETYITGMWLPRARRFVQDCRNGEDYPLDPQELPIYERAITFHPFNMSDPEVNALRGKNLIRELFGWRGTLGRRATEGGLWWPLTPEGWAEGIRKEREEIERLGYIMGAGATRESWEALEEMTAARGRELVGRESTSLKRRRWE